MRAVTVAAVGLAALPVLAGCGTPAQQQTARAYLDAWSHGRVDDAARRTTDPTRAAQTLEALRKDLHVTAVTTQLGRVRSSGGIGTAEFTAALRLGDVGTWRYTGQLALQKTGGTWRVRWTTQDVHPRYADGARLVLRQTLPPRADLLDLHGNPIFTSQPVVDVGIEPARAGAHLASTVAVLARVLDVDAARVTTAAKAAAPHAFVPVITLRQAAYDRVKARIHALPGTVFATRTEALPPSTGFGRALLGIVSNGKGVGGLQQALDTRLAGTPTSTVAVVTADGSTTATLADFPGHPGQPVRTTIDVAVQQAAESALTATTKPAALVAVRVSDGAILAAANAPSTTTFDRALVGHYPPGSTFKVVTSYALLGAGVTARTPVPCPPTLDVGGRTFRNFEGEASTSASFAKDFAVSCNTAFIGASRRLPDAALPAAADAFGIGGSWHLPLPAFAGSVPAPHDAVDAAAEAIGQGRVEVSPLTMATVAAAVAGGAVHPPVLTTDVTATPAPGRPLDAVRIATLRRLMRLVVTSGTAASAGLPPGTFGKTGTAEFGGGATPQTHAWFVGWRGDVAFAVVVEGGGVGGRVAAPIAAAFLRRLAPTRVG